MTDEPRPKRHKIGIACDMCRVRKVKCDGGRPTCSNCHRRLALGDRCAYSDPGTTGSASISTPSRPTPRTASASGVSVTPGVSETASPDLLGGHQNPPPQTQQTANHPRSVPYPHHPHHHPHHFHQTQHTQHTPHNGPRSFPTPSPAPAHTSIQYGSPHGTNTRSPSPGPGPATVGSNASGHASGPGSGPASGAILADSMTVVAEEGMQTLQYFGSSSAGSFTRQIKKAIDAQLGAASSASPGSTGPSFGGVEANLGATSMQASSVRQSRALLSRNDVDGDIVEDDDEEDGDGDMLELLPRRREADRLVGLYWRYVDPLYPFLDRRTWTPAYEALFDGRDDDGGDNDSRNNSHHDSSHNVAEDRVFISTLNIIFALSTQLSEGWPLPQESNAREGDKRTKQQQRQQQQRLVRQLRQRERCCKLYFARAQKLLQSSLWETAGSLATVQFLLLASQYLQSTNSPHQTWMVVGSTIRTAQSLGLHLKDDGLGTEDPLPLAERELRRRLWHGCVLMDRMVSVTHGRPVMISRELCAAVPLPLCSTQTGSDGPSLSFFIKSVKLYEIMNQVVAAFYTPAAAPLSTTNSSSAEKDALAMLLKLDEDLLEWERGLPEYLRFDQLKGLDEAEIRQRSRTDCKPRQAVILHVRFLQARMLLLRPVASRFCLDDAASTTSSISTTTAATSISATSFGVSSLRTRIKQDVAAICVEAAKAMIDVLERFGPGAQPASRDDIGLLPAWWYRVYYLYSAASILVLAKLRPDLFAAGDTQQAWDQAMRLLDGHKRFGLAAHRCVAALEILGGGGSVGAAGQGLRPAGQPPQPSQETQQQGQQQTQQQQQPHTEQHQQQPQHHQMTLQQYYQGDIPSQGLFMNMRPDMMHQNGGHHHQRDHHAPFASDFDFTGLAFDAQDFSDFNMHAWEVLNQP